MMRRVIALIGAPGAGKTTTGQGLAARLGCEFVDVDQLIESREGRTIPEIFLQQGEEFFRSREQEMTLTALGDGDGPHSDDMSARSACNSDATRVVALGGGGHSTRPSRPVWSRCTRSGSASVPAPRQVESGSATPLDRCCWAMSIPSW